MTDAREFRWTRVGRIAALTRPGAEGTLVVVPGAMSDAPGWLPFASALTTRSSIAIVNRRGRAPSDALPPDATVADEVDDLRALLATLERPLTVVGWSYGGLLTMEASVGLTDIRAIVLYEPVGGPFVPTAVAPIGKAVRAGDLDRAVELIITKVGGATVEQAAALRETPAWSYLKSLAIAGAIELAAINRHRPDFAAYRTIDAPLTILVGSLNKGREPYGAATARFLEALPNAREVMLDGQGHLAHAEAPDALAKVVSDLIAATP